MSPLRSKIFLFTLALLVLVVTGLNSFTTSRSLSDINATADYVGSAFQQTVTMTEAQHYANRAQFTATVLAQQLRQKSAEVEFMSVVLRETLRDAANADAYIGVLRQTLNDHNIMVPEQFKEPPANSDSPANGVFQPKADKEA